MVDEKVPVELSSEAKIIIKELIISGCAYKEALDRRTYIYTGITQVAILDDLPENSQSHFLNANEKTGKWYVNNGAGRLKSMGPFDSDEEALEEYVKWRKNSAGKQP